MRREEREEKGGTSNINNPMKKEEVSPVKLKFFKFFKILDPKFQKSCIFFLYHVRRYWSTLYEFS